MLGFRLLIVLAAAIALATTTVSQAPARSAAPATHDQTADRTASELRTRIESFSADLVDLRRRYDTPMSTERTQRLRQRYEAELQELTESVDFEQLSHNGRIDWILFENWLRRELHALQQASQRDAELVSLLPFAGDIAKLGEARRHLADVEARTAAETVDRIGKSAERVLDQLGPGGDLYDTSPQLRERAARRLSELRRALRAWFRYRDGYDPQFSWWVRAPHEQADQQIERLGTKLRRAAATGDGGEIDRTLIGDPVGEQALQQALAFEWIPYTPAELIEIAEREFAWCDREMAKAAEQLGCKDWREALETTKQSHRAPGEQPALIKELAHEAIDFLEARDLLTIPALAKECWRMSMMSREAQKVNPFFLGGNTIQVSFPTDAMAHIEKLQALRSNNEHFCRATVHHELIPGHWLQQYSQARHRTWRTPFRTPFWIEGWALYWEMRLYDLGLHHNARDRVGMLYWRKHRCARIVFSLNFHLGEWTGPQCVEYLIERVGHERAAAEGEVRRSVGGAYPPLYQAAYMLGGLQIRALHRELVVDGTWTERQFHDAILRENSIPIAVLRMSLGTAPPPRKLPEWRF
ncbi:MAG: DUF885 family protein [Planctomycetota bacterium]